MKRDAKATIPQVLTANALGSGLVVFRTLDGDWSTHIADAQIVEDADDAEALTAAGVVDELNNRVVGPYLVNVRVENSVITPILLREVIRAAGGPTASTSLILARAAHVSTD